MTYRPLSTCDPSVQIYVWGSNSYGKLPSSLHTNEDSMDWSRSGKTVPGVLSEHDDESEILVPTRVDLSHVLNHQPIKQIACSFEGTFILTESKEVYFCGKLGSHTQPRLELVKSLQRKGVVKIVSGHDHVLFLTDMNQVYGCGNCLSHQLQTPLNPNFKGITEPEHQQIFKSESDRRANKVIDIACGARFSLFLCCSTTDEKSQSLWGCGDGSYGTLLGLGDTPIPRKLNIDSVIKKDKKLIKNIFCGYNHVILLTTDGTVYVFGGNYNGQLGIAQHKHHIGTPFKLDCFNEPVVSVSCGNNHVFYRLASGRVYSCGRNEYFESGVPMDTSLYAPVEVDFANHLPNGKTRVSSVFCGSWHSIFLTEDQQLYSSGINENGELGLGFKAQGRDKNRAVPSKMNVKYPVPVEPSRYEMKVACGSAHSILYFARKEQNVMRENLFRLLREDRQTFICTDLSIKTVN